ncbi:hypothetical protein GCM10027160_07610 [Streptomyces calidiresistens]|uniref:Carbon monoxide dehydrogenase subunit G n=1 Tax=Streptomyces calidiresistens TaxID=1485586 RepID=A0A7W3T4Y6_9ACTN|nr:SRPBCC family protein [Streptomyces calidiresistens]MBB0231055.1 hypothetical protein [Streptomyces calidiresistens]
MEHEVHIPYPVAEVRAALGDPARALTLVPGFHPDPDSEPGAPGGRLRVRVGGSTITYRGTLTAVSRGEGFAVTAEGVEARGGGGVRLTLDVVPRPDADGTGTTLVLGGTVEARGRLADAEPRQREAAARRLLDRFAEALAASLGSPGPAGGPEGTAGRDSGAGVPPAGEGGAGPDAPAGDGRPSDAGADTGAGAGEAPAEGEAAGTGEPEGAGGPERAPGGSDARETGEAGTEGAGTDADADATDNADTTDADEPDDGIRPPGPGPVTGPDLVAAGPLAPEADLARRTMIGRSAEEVDHAPPRGRYAPEPGPGVLVTGRGALRWAAPAAALAAAAGAVLVGRALRRRR